MRQAVHAQAADAAVGVNAQCTNRLDLDQVLVHRSAPAPLRNAANCSAFALRKSRGGPRGKGRSRSGGGVEVWSEAMLESR